MKYKKNYLYIGLFLLKMSDNNNNHEEEVAEAVEEESPLMLRRRRPRRRLNRLPSPASSRGSSAATPSPPPPLRLDVSPPAPPAAPSLFRRSQLSGPRDWRQRIQPPTITAPTAPTTAPIAPTTVVINVMRPQVVEVEEDSTPLSRCERRRAIVAAEQAVIRSLQWYGMLTRREMVYDAGTCAYLLTVFCGDVFTWESINSLRLLRDFKALARVHLPGLSDEDTKVVFDRLHFGVTIFSTGDSLPGANEWWCSLQSVSTIGGGAVRQHIALRHVLQARRTGVFEDNMFSGTQWTATKVMMKYFGVTSRPAPAAAATSTTATAASTSSTTTN